MAQVEPKFELEDDAKDSVSHLIEHRLPWLAAGLVGGILTSFIVSKFEKILASDIRLAFFIPVIVYMSDAVGTQTEAIYVRRLAKKGVSFSAYLFKETMLGLSLGLLFGLAIGVVARVWLGSSQVAWTVALAMFLNVTIAPVLALIVPTILNKEHTDPALGAGPFATIIQDLISLMIYFLIAAIIIF